MNHKILTQVFKQLWDLLFHVTSLEVEYFMKYLISRLNIKTRFPPSSFHFATFNMISYELPLWLQDGTTVLESMYS